jgi:hypothetical protein
MAFHGGGDKENELYPPPSEVSQTRNEAAPLYPIPMRIRVILWEILGNFRFGILGQLGPLIRKVSDRRNTGRSRRAVGSLSAISALRVLQPQRRRNRACGRTVPRESGLGPTCLYVCSWGLSRRYRTKSGHSSAATRIPDEREKLCR